MNLQEANINANSFSQQISASVSKGIDYLYHHQYPNGEFCVYIGGDEAMQTWTCADTCVFPSALIGFSLLPLSEYPKAEEILAKTAAFLRYQMARGGTWNHYTNLHYLRKVCPVDVDDTACVSYFLTRRNIEFPKDSATSLLLNNRRNDGLFYTWITLRFRLNRNKTYWRIVLKEFLRPVKTFLFWRWIECRRYDADAIVNANVLFYLGDRKETQAVIQLLIRIIIDRKEGDCDKVYRNPFTAYYFISRNYHAGISKLEPVKKPIVDRILLNAESSGRIGESILDTALAVCSLLNLNYSGNELHRAIHFILRSQNETGDWDRWLLYHSGPSKKAGWGSEEMTTAFCLEALQRYRNLFA